MACIWSCETDSILQQSVKFEFDPGVVAAAEKIADVRILNGYAGVQRNSFGELVVRFATTNDPEHVDQLFILHGCNKSYQISNTQAQLIVSPVDLLLKTSNEMVYLSIEDFRGNLIQRLPESFKFSESITGFGLANWNIEAYKIENTDDNFSNSLIAAFNQTKISKTTDMNPPDCDQSCDAGGVGATSCSLSGSCSVTCGAGYYACCQWGFPDTCGCCPNS